MKPSGRVVVISGGSRGLGARMAESFLSCGDSVASFARKATPLTQQMQASSDRFCFEELDATSSDGLSAFVDSVTRRWGRVDVLINNAAMAQDGLLSLACDDDLDRLVEINLTSVLRLTRACVRAFLRGDRGGRIVNITSIVARRGFAGLSAYSATKAALVGLTKSLARELGPRSITVNAVAPGFLETEMTHGITNAQRQQIVRRTPLGRLGTCADVVPLVEFLTSDAARFITGEVIVVDGGCTC